MGRQPSLSVITLTKNRATLLRKCLQSLCGQLTRRDEIIIIDNNSIDDTDRVIQDFQKKLPIRVYRSGALGYPALYNNAIKKSNKDVLVFLDDDCIAVKHYLKTIRLAHQREPTAVIQGRTRSLPFNNIYAQISEDHLRDWFEKNLMDNVRLRVIDNRNVSIPRLTIQKYGGFSQVLTLGSEDIELGRRLYLAGVQIIYRRDIITYHHERTTLKDFLRQRLRMALSHGVYDSVSSQSGEIGPGNRGLWKAHLRTAARRELLFLRKVQYKKCLLLPIVYVGLFGVRLLGYFWGRHRQKQLVNPPQAPNLS